jgi:hypothetical protein
MLAGYDSLMFQLPFGFIQIIHLQFSESTKFETKALRRHFKMSGLKKSVIRNMVMIIDEVSMLRADLLDAMDYMMQTVRKKLLWRSSVVYWRFIAVATGNSGRRMAY